jgi:glucose/arabinose dehydrogenase
VFDSNPGYAAGLVTFAFDPEYATNGKFYTVHTELGGNATEYREAVLTEWHDNNISDASFAGTRATLMRIQYNDNIHPMGDIAFNPLATSPAHADWRNMYLSNGDGGAGEQSSSGVLRNQPQMLNNLLGKVMRITPSASGTNGTYAIPADNPFVSAPAGRDRRSTRTGFAIRIGWDSMSIRSRAKRAW